METKMKTIILIVSYLFVAAVLAIALTGCGGYNIKEDGLLGAPLGTMMYWSFGADKESTSGGSGGENVNVNVYDWSAR